MSDSGPIDPKNHGTFIAVTLIVSVLALFMGVFAWREARVAGVAAAALEVRDQKQEAASSKADEARIAALEAKIAALEAKVAAPPPPAVATDAPK